MHTVYVKKLVLSIFPILGDAKVYHDLNHIQTKIEGHGTTIVMQLNYKV